MAGSIFVPYANLGLSRRLPSNSIPSMTTFTAMAWAYIDIDRNAQIALFYCNVWTTDASWLGILTSSDGTTLSLEKTGGAVSGTNLTVGKWYHICLSKSGSAHTVYLNGVSDITSTDATSVASINSFQWGDAGTSGGSFGVPWSGRLAAAKIWDGVALTRDEVRAEMRQVAPARKSALWYFNPWHNVPSDLPDYSGGAHAFTAGATVTATAGPQIPWEITRNRLRKPGAVAAGTGSGLLLGGVRNYLVREAY